MIFTKRCRGFSRSSISITVPIDVVEGVDIQPDDLLTVDIIKVTKK